MNAHACQKRAWLLHEAEIRAFLAYRCETAAAADDLLQEVFLRALAQEEKFCKLDSPRAWLFTVARRLLIDRARLAKEQLPLPDDLNADPDVEVAPVDRLSQCLPRVLSELSEEDCEAITWCDIRGISQKDYAQQLGLSLPAAKSRVQRARVRLRAQLADACQIKFDEDGKVCCFVPRPFLDSEPSP